MPRVPHNFSPVQAETTALTPVRMDTSVDSTELAAISGRQIQQAGNALVGLSGATLEIATRAQQDANQVLVDGALNDVRQKAFDLAYDPQAGYLALKGNAALQREGGRPLAEEYSDKLRQSVEELSGKLGNDEQRRQFALRANDVLTSFRGDVERHTLQEFKHYNLSVQDGAIKLGTDEAKRNWRDPLKIDTALQSVSAAVVRAGQLQGDSANETLAKMKVATSNIHLGVIHAALEEGHPSYASQYLQKYKDGMTADDLLKASGVITKDLDARIAQQTVMTTTQKLAPRFQPSDMDRLKGIVSDIESGGRGTNADGTPLASAKGALFRMQVMPATAKDPGFGIRPAADNSAAEYNRVGEELLPKLVERYGNIPQALAAYNAGAGRVDAAIAAAKNPKSEHGTDWQAYLPQETQDYVRKGMAKFVAGGGRAPMPSEIEFVQDAVDRLGPGARADQIKLTRTAAEHQYGLITKAVKQQEDEAVAGAMRGILENGGRYSELPLSVRAAVPPKEIDNLIGFAQKISKGDDSTSLWLYNRLTAHPEELARMNDNEFFALRRELSEADYKHFSNERAKLIGATPGSNGPGELNSSAVKQALDERLRMLNIDPTPKDDGGADAARVGGIRRFVDQYFIGAQREAGKKFSDAEVAQHLDGLFAKNAEFRGWFSKSSGPLLAMKAGDIPTADRDGIKAALKRSGVDNPTDAQILNAYWTLKTTRK